MSAPTAGPFLGALDTQLRARLAADPDFEDVEVHFLISPDIGNAEAIVLLRGEPIQERFEFATVGQRARDNEVQIPGLVRTGTTDRDGLQSALERAAALIGEVAAELRDNWPDVGVQTRSASVTATSWSFFLSDKGGLSVVGDFEITYTARVT